MFFSGVDFCFGFFLLQGNCLFCFLFLDRLCEGKIKHCMQLPHNYDGANYLPGAVISGAAEQGSGGVGGQEVGRSESPKTFSFTQ